MGRRFFWFVVESLQSQWRSPSCYENSESRVITITAAVVFDTVVRPRKRLLNRLYEYFAATFRLLVVRRFFRRKVFDFSALRNLWVDQVLVG